MVLAADAAAQAAGLHVGMAATQAQVLVPGLLIQSADPAADAAALEQLAFWALRHYAPIAAADPPDGIVIDTAGADHLHGGEAAMLSAMVERLEASGVTTRAAVAETWGAAHALARYAARPIQIVPPGGVAAAIAPLPFAALRLPPSTVSELRTLGFARIADIMATPRPPLALRFGPEILRRLDQALGRAAEAIDPIRPDALIEVHRQFPEPIAAAETIARYIGKLVVQLCAALEAQGLGARRLDLICHRVDRRAQAIRVGTATPIRDARRLTSLL